MNWITGVQRAINYVEDHLTEDIDYEKIASESFSSSYHFQRVFSILCGYTLGEYIRLRLKDTALTVREGDIFLGGVIAADPARGLRADLSFDAAMADAESRFGEVSGLEIGG